jgi:Protein involved in initiation of plasmid replication
MTSATDRATQASEERKTVVKSNRMVKAKTPFTKLEHRVVASLIAQIDRDQESFGIQRVSLRNIIERAGVSSTEIFRKARDICDRLVEKSVGICTYDEDRGRVYTAYTLFRQCRYVEQEGLIEAKFEEEMRPLLLQLKNRFTMYSLSFFLRLPSRHSMRIYELLKMREDLGAMRISVEEFRETLGLENSYDRFTDLRRLVVEKARHQIDENTDIRFTYRVEREGRTAKWLRFFVQRNGEEASTGEAPVEDDSAKGAPAEGLAPQTDVNVDTGSETDLRFDVKTWFLKGLSQEEVRGIGQDEIEALHESARLEAEKCHPGGTKSVIASETLRRMEEKWESSRP